MFGVRKKPITKDDSSFLNHSHSHLILKPKSPFSFKFKLGRPIWLGLGSVSFLSISGGLVYGWFFIDRHLAPILEQELTNFLNRPVKIGSVEGISLTGVRFGKSEILPTSDDPAKISLEQVDVTFNPIKLLTHSQLALDVKAIRPDIYVQQGVNGAWLITPFDAVKSTGNEKVTVELETLRFIDADVIVAARSATNQLQSPVNLFFPAAKLDFSDQGRIIDFEGLGKLAKGGQVKLSGVGKTNTQEINLSVVGDQVKATDVKDLLPLPFNLNEGEIGANLTVKLRPKQSPSITGIATLNNVTAQIPQLPQSFTQSKGILRFNQTTVNLEGVTTQFGQLTGVTNGKIDLAKGYDIQAKTEPFLMQNALKSLNLPVPTVPMTAQLQSNIKVKGSLAKPEVSLTVNSTQPAKIDQIDFKSLKANLQVSDSQISLSQFQALPTVGGELTAQGKINPQTSTVVLDVKASHLPSQDIAQLYKTSIPSSVGKVSGQVNILGNFSQANSWKGRGTVNFAFGQGTINLTEVEYLAGKWQGKLQATDVEVTSLGVNIPKNIPHGRVNADLNVSGNQNSFTPDTILVQGVANLGIAEGKITANNLQLAQGKWKTDLQVQGVRVNPFVPNLPEQFDGRLGGNFAINGDLNSTLADIQGTGKANLTLGSGTIQATDLQLNQGNWKGNLQTDNLQIARFMPDLPTSLQGKLKGTVTLSGNLNSSLKQIEGQGQVSLISKSGTITAQNLQLKQGQFTTLLTPEQVKLASFSPQLKGHLGGKLNISGDINNLNPETIKAQGTLNFSQGLALINHPLTTKINWSGNRLDILEATANNFKAKGFVAVDLSNQDIQQFDLNVDAQNLNLKSLAQSLPVDKINYEGSIDFTGKISGTPEKPAMSGELALENFNVANLAFEPVLQGSINLDPNSGVKLQLAGNRDKIHLNLDQNYQPLAFAFNVDQIAVEGTYQNQNLLTTANNIPLEFLTELAKSTDVPLPKTLLSQPIEGQLSGNFALNINDQNFSGENLVITDWRWGYIRGDRFSGNISLKEGNISLSDGELQQKNSLYRINGTVTQSSEGPQLHTEVAVTGGEIQDILETLQIFELSDFKRGLTPPNYGKAKDLWTAEELENPPADSSLYSVGLSKAPLAQQLEYFTKLSENFQKTEQEQQNASSLPELGELKGKFDGKIVLDASMKAGIEAKFDVKGQDWQWESYKVQHLQAKGDFKDGLLKLEPISLQLDESLIAFSGEIDQQTQTGTLQLQNIPLHLIQKFVTLPPNMDVEGDLNGEIVLDGKRDNPEIRGEMAIAKASLNQIPIQATEGEFTYQNSRFNFSAGSIVTNQTAPVKIEGSFPYQLPFAKVAPTSDDLNLNIRVQNEGLALLDVLTQGQVSWKGGKGEVNVDIAGKFDQQKARPTQLKAEGIAQVENATIASQILPDVPLTGVEGKILFNFDQIQVEHLKGNFSGGKITVAGTLPLLFPIPMKDPLTIEGTNLALHLKGLYQGEVNGKIQVGGSVLTPQLGGEINLDNGQIFLNESIAQTETNATPKKGLASLTGFKDLNLYLGDNVWISLPPVMHILATGNLNINGSLDKPLPEGEIKLEAGQVNLFSAQFGLVGGEVNTAKFTPNRGLDPYLDVQMTAVVSETTRNAVRINPLSSEVKDNSIFPSDSLQTVHINAKVDGFASQLTQSLEVTSLPPRSEGEIIALLGGNFINPVVEKDPRLGLANLAGSAVFGTIQGPISKVLGLSDFRVYPTQLINEKERISDYQIGIAAEASVDLRDNLSLSIQKILNTDLPPHFGLRYRINNNTVIRGTSNFSDDNRGMVEYQRRF